jgi:hypothetical protein
MYIRVSTHPVFGESISPFENTLAGTLMAPTTPPNVDTLTCRLLHAANVAYGISFNKAGGFVPPSPYYENARFVTPPIPLVASTNNIDGCLIGTLQGSATDPAQPSVVLAFRGTYPPDPGPYQRGERTAAFLRDWANNFVADPVDFKANSGATVVVPGKVHRGFAGSVQTLFDKGLVQALKQRLSAYPGAPLYVTGHSKGGAMAYLGAVCLQRMHQINPAAVITFAAPRVGDQTFVNAYNASGINSLRYEFQDDIVPNLPPSNTRINRAISLIATPSAIASKVLSSFKLKLEEILRVKQAYDIVNSLHALKTVEFESAGTLRFIDWEWRIVGDSPELQTARNQRLAMWLLYPRLWPQAIRTIALAHPASCGSGYMRAICPTGGC